LKQFLKGHVSAALKIQIIKIS